MTWRPFATMLERADAPQVAGLNGARLRSTRPLVPARVLVVLMILLAANLAVSWFLWNEKSRPLVYYEYLLAPLLCLYVSKRSLHAVIFGGPLLLDLLYSGGSLYQHDGIAFAIKLPQLFRSDFGWGFWGLGLLAVSLLGVILAGFAALQAWMQAGHSRKACCATILVLTVIVLIADVVNGSAGSLPFTGRNYRVNLAGTLLFSLRSSFHGWSVGRQPLQTIPHYRSDKQRLCPSFEHFTSGKNRQILVLVESWGVVQDCHLRELQEGLLKEKLTSRYDHEFGSCSCAGSTAGAEARELLGREPDAYYALLRHGPGAEETLVSRMKRDGKNTIAIFPYQGHFGQATDFRTRLGFDKVLSMQELQAASLGAPLPVNRENQYGALNDEAAFAAAADCINRADKIFVYVTTINTHLPFRLALDVRQGKGYKLFAARWQSSFPSETCMEHFFRIQNLLQSLATHLQAGVVDEVVIVGDHSPPFLGHAERAFFKPSTVPYVVLRKRITNQ